MDLDLAGIVTELATGSALAQRAGRVNRVGKRAEEPVAIVVPDGGSPASSNRRLTASENAAATSAG